jgi:hypothetical protein
MMFEGEALLKYFYSNKIIKVSNALLLLAVLLSSGFYGCSKRLEIEKSDETGSNFKCFNVSARVECLSIERTADFGFIYSGIDKSIPGNAQGFLMKVDSTGKQEWYRTFGGANNDGFEHAIQTSDGGYLAVGSTNSLGIGLNFAFQQSGYFVKINSSGILEWERDGSWHADTPPFEPLPSQLNHCVEAKDHTFVVAGFFHYIGNNSMPTVGIIDPSDGSYIIGGFVNPNAIVNWYPFVARSGWWDMYSDVSISDDNSIIVSGEMSSWVGVPGSSLKVPLLAKLSMSSLDPAFYQKYNFDDLRLRNNQNYLTYIGGQHSLLNFNLSYTRKFAPHKVLNQSDGGYLMGSFITPDNNAAESLKFYMSLVKTDDFGDYQWSKKYKGLGTAMLWDIQQTKEGNTLLIGSSSTENFTDYSRQGFTNSKIAILTVDKDGNLLKELFIGGDQSICIAKSLHQLSDGGYLIAGISYDSKGDRNQMFYVHVNQDGAIVQ